jgi:hypothetical protein
MTAQTQTTIANIVAKKNATERLSALEAQMETQVMPALRAVQENIVPAIDREFRNLHGRVGGVQELLRALLEVVGPDAVNAVLVENRKKDDEANTKAQVDAIAQGLTAGALVKADVISEKSLMVFVEKDETGTPVALGSRKQFVFTELQPEFRAQVTGKGVGEVLVDPQSKHTFTVVELYEAVPTAAKTEDPTELVDPSFGK